MTRKLRLKLLVSSLALFLGAAVAAPVAAVLAKKPAEETQQANSEEIERTDDFEYAEDIAALSAPMLSGNETLRAANEDVVYLSDIPYLSNSSVGWGSLLLDKTSADGARITLNMNGSWVSFDKGIYAHADSNVYYDLQDYGDYDYFQAYYGVNSSSNNKGDGVKFGIYTSNTLGNWTVRMAFGDTAMKSGDSCGFIKIDIRGCRYLRLQCYQNGNNGNDHSCWADAKLVKSDYREFVTDTPEEYDERIRTYYNAHGAMDDELELMVLQRYLVSKIGNYQLKQLYKYQEYQETFDWLFNDLYRMRTFINGGAPEGTWFNAFVVLSRLHHAYGADLNDDRVSPYNIAYKDIFFKQMCAISLVYSRRVEFWIKSSGNASPNTNVSDPLVKYNIYKTLFLANKLNNMYGRLEVEEMRAVVWGEFADDEAYWLNDYTRTSGKNLYQPYSFIFYKKTEPQEYRQAKYYGENRKAYEKKYKLTGYDIANDKYYPKSWMIMQNGGQCWQVALLCCSVLNVNGIPAYGVVQWPAGKVGHQAYLSPWMNGNGDLNWGLYNDAYGWDECTTIGVDGDTRRLFTMRLPLGWGHGDYVTKKGQASYIYLGQAALNNYNALTKAAAYVKLADSFSEATKKEEIYKKAIAEQSIHFDAWLKLVDLYKTSLSKTDEELVNFIGDMCENLKGYPLPMYDLHRRVVGLVQNSTYQLSANGARQNALNWAATNGGGAGKHMANYLLGKTPAKTVSFSFTSEPANKLVFEAAKTADSSFTWDYSIDGGNTWTTVYDSAERYLTHEEVERLTASNDILVHILGMPYNSANYFKVDLVNGAALNVFVCANNNEKTMRGVTGNMEWRYVGDEVWTKNWTSMTSSFSGEVEIEVRNAANGLSLPGPAKRFTFSERETSPEHTYISPLNNTYGPSALGCSSESSGSTLVGNAFDTIFQGGWVSKYDAIPYIDVQLINPTYVSRVQWMSATVRTDAKPVDVTVYSGTTGDSWPVLVKKVTGLNVQGDYVNIDFEPVYTKYLRIAFNKTTSASGGKYMIQVGELGIFRDITKIASDIDVVFSTTSPTNENVIATLTPAAGVTIPLVDGLTYNGETGKYSYTFTQNKRVTLSYTNAGGQSAAATIDVDWIDKVKPTYKLVYNTTSPTNGNVTVVCNTFEQVVFVQEGNKNFHTFEENGSFTFIIRDAAGNETSATATVDYIDHATPVATVSYLPKRETDYPVTAEIVFDKRVELLNNNGEFVDQGDGTAYRYVFRKNGTYELHYKDLVGNVGQTTLSVNWIRPGLAETFITYTSDEIVDPDSPFNSTTTWGNVTATLTYDENDPVTVLNNGGSNTVIFYENGMFEFEFRDARGNIGKAVAEVNWIEKELPVTFIEYDKTTNCTAPVQATFRCEESVTITNNGGSNVYSFTQNGKFTFFYRYTDSNGNVVTGVAHAVVDWIDDTPPTADVSFNYTAKTDRDVVATLIPSEEVTVTNNGGSLSYTFTQNGSFTFEFVDAVGFSGSKTVTVDWIDRDLAATSVSYDVTEQTGGNVTATLIFSENMTCYGNYRTTHVFTDNGEYVFLYADANGNVGAVTATVNWIDKTPPVGTITYNVESGVTVTSKDNLPVMATLSCDKPVTVLNNNGQFTRAFEYNGSFTFEFMDEAGNIGAATATVNCIQVRATVWAEYSTTEPTADSVFVTLKSDRPITITSPGGATREVKYSGLVSFEYKWRDETGYNGSLTVSVDWAKCNVPSATVSYSTTAKTNGNVTATVAAASESRPITVTSIIKIKADGAKETIPTSASSYEFTENGKIIFVFEDASHIAGSAGAEVSWIDRVAPQASATYSTRELTCERVTATVTFTKSGTVITDTGYEFVKNNNGTYTIPFDENGTRRVNFSDAAGNTGYIDLAVSWIDKLLPQASVTYSTTSPTNGAVTAKLTFTKPSYLLDNVVFTRHADGSCSVPISENGTQTVRFRDDAGNINSVDLTVTWIDKTPPEVTVAFSTTDFTINDVTAYLTFSEPVTIVGDSANCVPNGAGGYSLLFVGNSTKTVCFRDAAGNENSEQIKVDWIDRMFQSVAVAYSTQQPTTQPVTATITFNCDVTVLNTDVTVNKVSEGVFTVLFVSNDAYEIAFQDADGYVGSVSVLVDWIDYRVPATRLRTAPRRSPPAT